MSDEDDDAAVSEESDADKQPSAVDPNAHRKARNRKKREADVRAEFWRDVFSSEVGRREMWNLLVRIAPTNVQMALTPAGFPDERATWMQLGTHLVRQEIFMDWLETHPELVLLMRQENDPRHKKVNG